MTAEPPPPNHASTEFPPDRAAVTRLLQAAAGGSPSAPAELLPLVYAQLRAIAQRKMAGERGGGRAHTLQATALVHEAYVRLVGGQSDQPISFDGRAHFFAAAATAMQRILIEHARSRMRVKRGGEGVGGGGGAGGRGARRMPMGDVVDLVAAAEDDPEQIVSLDGALCRLEKEDAGLAQIVRLRFYGGLSIEETAAALQISTATLKRRWAFARAWLYRAVSEPGSDADEGAEA